MTRLIDADALKNTFKDKEGNEFTAFHFYDAIDNAPTVERPHGEWICKGAVGNGTWCSSCDAHFSIFPNRYNFSPNCGFPMNEEALEILRKREGDRNEID